jgi:tetratricopeptide (TPR) repeat protein
MALAHGGLPRTGAVLDLDRGVAEVARRIGLAVHTQIPVQSPGARWVFPRMLEAAQDGDEVTVFVRRPAQAQSMALEIGATHLTVAPVGVTPALLGRAIAAAEIAELDRQLAAASGAEADRLRGEIIQRSIAARVVSSQTSMLVLESDADYARYGIDRTTLADILAIGPSGVELLHRAPPAQLQIAAPQSPTGAVPQAVQNADKYADRDAKKQGGPREEKAKRDEGKLANKPALDPGANAALRESEAAAAQSVVTSAVDQATAPDPEPAPMSEPAPGAPADRARRRIETSGGASAGSGAGAAQPAIDERPRPAPSVAPRPRRVAAAVEHEADGLARISADVDDDDGLAGHRRLPALHGPLAEIERALAAGSVDRALATARAWHDREPGDVLALIGLGDALEARHDLDAAARVYGSIIDLYPARADFRRFAGERLERVGNAQRALIIDTYRRAVEQRPDHLTGHRLLAYALVRDAQYPAAFAAILDGFDRHYPENRFAGAERVLAEDVGLIAAAYLAKSPDRRGAVMAELDRRGIALPTQPSTRFILYWETDGNDVDFHIRDAHGGHAWYSHKQLASGGELYADITTGYGPECFAIPGTPHVGPYRLSINYFSQGPMGYGMGLLQIQTFDGRGQLRFEDRPYVIMTNQAFVDLGTYR